MQTRKEHTDESQETLFETFCVLLAKGINCDVAMKGKNARLDDHTKELLGLLFQVGHVWFRIRFCIMRAFVSFWNECHI